ncbi:MAG: asparagine synthase (glutamine-hydrolyzing) [Saprospiraceae bacterium]
MCGIIGIFNLNEKPVSLSLLKRLTNEISHRGPDDEGYYTDKNLGLGHRRLSILDTSPKGKQPMMSKDGKWVIIFNGCIYNFLQLKVDLQSKGHDFISTSDTEVVCEGIAEYGVSFFEKLDGMFAIAAWNTKERKLYISRDRHGVKPIYYWLGQGVLVFASEIKAIIKHPDYSIAVNNDALNEYFTFQNVFRYHTLFQGVTMLPPANTVEVDISTKGVKHRSWWDYDFSQPDESMSFESAKEGTIHLFKQAVTKQMISDVPVGSYLSGGMDSGSITAIASSQVDRLCTFTCGFDMSHVSGVEANYDERRDAEIMASYFNTEHYEQVINSGDLRWSLPRVVWHLEDLRVGMSYPNYYISRLASKFVKVCLQGTGGDELFGGYPWRYYKVFDSINQESYFEKYYEFWQRLVPDNEKNSLFTNQVLSNLSLGLDAPKQSFKNVFLFNDKLQYNSPEDHIQNSLYFEIKTFLSGLLLVGDKLSMANGLEERFPFLDNDLVNFAQKIPIRHKLGNLTNEIKRIDENVSGNKHMAYREFNDGKNVLRKSMLTLLPERIINRKKQGFSAPDESWYRGANADYVKDLLLGQRTVSAEFINPDYIKKTIDEHVNKRINHRLRIWSFMNFEWWCRLFLDGQSIDNYN